MKPSKKEKDPQSENQSASSDNDIDKFGELLRVMDLEHLLRFRKRLELVGRKQMVKILTYEIKARQAIEQEEANIEINRLREEQK